MYKLILLLIMFVPDLLAAQNAPVFPTVPTTHILAIGTITAPLTLEEKHNLMPKEVAGTVQLYLNGKIDQWWAKQDGTGVVFLLNMTSVDEAEAMLEKLPLGVARRMTFQFLPLGPLNPLHVLLRDSTSH